jgi:hypothetical protein
MNSDMLQLAKQTKYTGFVSIGDLFGYWKILDNRPYITKNKRQGSIYFLCQCKQCYKVDKFVNVHQLKKYKLNDAGGCISCSRKRNTPTGNKNVLWKGYEEIPMSYIHNIRNSAIRRGLTWQVTEEYIWNLFVEQNRRCKISGVDLKFSSTINARDGTASLDRIDRHCGYVEGNLQWLHKKVNEMKWDMSDEEFISWCNIISQYNNTHV